MRPPAAVIIAVGAAIGFFTVAPAGGAAAPRELRFFTHDTGRAQLDLGDKGDSPGDRYVFSGDVFDHQGGTKVGRLTGACETISRQADGDGEDLCVANLDLARGQLTTSATLAHAAFLGGIPQDIAVTGGTGTYRGARGDATVTVVNASDTDTVVHID
jgi:hypothetical protein